MITAEECARKIIDEIKDDVPIVHPPIALNIALHVLNVFDGEPLNATTNYHRKQFARDVATYILDRYLPVLDYQSLPWHVSIRLEHELARAAR